MARPPKLPALDAPRTATGTVQAPNSRYLVATIDDGSTTPHLQLKPAGYALIERMSAAGRDLTSIARALGIHRDTFRILRKRDAEAQEAIDRGRAALGDELTDILLDHARGGFTVAAIFLAKARCGWREGEAMPGTVNNTQYNVTIQLPPATDPVEFAKLLPASEDAP